MPINKNNAKGEGKRMRAKAHARLDAEHPPDLESSFNPNRIGEGAAFCGGLQVTPCKVRSLGYRSAAR